MNQKTLVALFSAVFAVLLFFVSFAPNTAVYIGLKLLLISGFAYLFYSRANNFFLSSDPVPRPEGEQSQGTDEEVPRIKTLESEQDVDNLFEDFLHTLLGVMQQVLVADTVVLLFLNYQKKRFYLRHQIARYPESLRADRHIELENSLLTMVLKNRQGIVEPNLPENHRLLPYYRPDAPALPRSFLATPVYFGNHIIGILCADSRAEQSFGEDDLELLTQFARLVSLQLVASNKVFEYETENWISRVLYQFSREILALQERTELWPLLGQFCKKELPADRVAICERRGPGQAQVVFLAGDFMSLNVGLTIPFTEGIVGWVFRKNQSLRVEDFAGKDHYIARFYADEPQARAYRSLLTAPVTIQDEVQAVVLLESFAPGAFKETHKQVLETICNLSAVAVEKLHHLQRRSAARKSDVDSNEEQMQLNLPFQQSRPSEPASK